MTDRAPRPEGMSDDDLKRLAKVAKDADDAVSGPWSMDDHIVKPGDTPNQWHVYEQLEDDPPFATVDDPRLARHIATFDPAMCEALVVEVRRLRADGATLTTKVDALHDALTTLAGEYETAMRTLRTAEQRADEALAAHSASFGALQTLSAALFDGEVDDYAALAEKIIGRVRQAEADGATLRERVRQLPNPIDLDEASRESWQHHTHHKCVWCGLALSAQYGEQPRHPDNGCLWSDVHKDAK